MLPPDSRLKFPHILSVTASAGSGKTYLLALRFLQFLLSSRIPNSRIPNLLAITFTNDAALEMKRRILCFLKELALNASPELFLKFDSLLVGNTKDLSNRAEHIVNELFENYDFWQIRTIDSFLHQLVYAAGYDLGISPEYEIYTNQQEFFQRALDRLLLKAGQDEELLQHIFSFLKFYLSEAEKTSWWPQYDILQVVTDLYEKENGYGLPLLRPVGTCLSKNEIVNEIAEFVQMVRDFHLQFNKNTEKAIENAKNGRFKDAFDKACFQKEDVSELFLKKGSLSGIPDAIQGKWQEIRRSLNEYAIEQAQRNILSYLDLMEAWKDVLATLKQEERAVFFGDITALVHRIYVELSLPDLFFRLGERIFHILIDEFQDTSSLQWLAIQPLVEEALSKGGSFFCVGDEKQLLYRWRGADSSIFRKAPRALAHQVEDDVQHLVLPENWRSHRVIVDFVGQVFHEKNLIEWAYPLNGTRSESNSFISRLAEQVSHVFSHVQQTLPQTHEQKRSGGLVYMEYMDGQKGEDLLFSACEWTAQLLQDTLKRYRPEDIFVLLRKNDEVERFTAHLAFKGIAVYSERQMDIRRNRLVQTLLAMLRLIFRPDNLCVAQVLTSELFSEFWQRFCGEISPLEWIENVSSEPLLSAWKQGLSQLWEATFGGPLKDLRFWPVYEIVSRLLQFFHYSKSSSHEEAVVEYLLELLQNTKDGATSDIASLLEWFEKANDDIFIMKNVKSSDAVRIMTIHKSKGLQAKVVILPIATIICEGHKGIYFVAENDCLKAMKIPKYLYSVSSALNEIVQKEQINAWLDELRTLYVAVTRAEEELYMLLPEKKGRYNNRLLPLLNCVIAASDKNHTSACPVFRLGTPVAKPIATVHSTSQTPHGLLYQSEQKDWAWLNSIRHRAFSLPLSANMRAIELGEAVHRLLAGFTSLPCGLKGDVYGVYAFLKTLWQGHATDEARILNDHEQLLQSIAKTLCRNELNALFWPDTNTKIWIERELVGRNGELYRMDRVVQSDGEIVVMEFKTGAGGNEGVKQLKKYLQEMQCLYTEMQVKGCLIYFMRQEVLWLTP